jgi:hypothetical protein
MNAESQPVRNASRLLAGACVLGLIGYGDAWRKRERPGAIESIGLRIDPNEAPWWELTVIPDVGPSTARAIVRHREDHERTSTARPVFRRLADLDEVDGIGPKTIERMRPELRLPQE